jgi:hypothetical protein
MSAFKDTLKGINKSSPEPVKKEVEVISAPVEVEKTVIQKSVYTDPHLYRQNLEASKILDAPIEDKPKPQPKPTKLKTIKLLLSVSRLIELIASLEQRTQQDIIQDLIITYAQNSPYKESLKEFLK